MKTDCAYHCMIPVLPHPDKVVQCRVSSMHQIVDVAQLFYPNDECWVFRGQSNASWHLETSLERKFKPSSDFGEALSREEKAIRTFRELTRGRLDFGANLIDWLSAMQHYGVPTRLLDFTRSFFVALFFASQNACDTAKDFAVWCLNLKKAFDKSDIIDETIRREAVAASEKSNDMTKEEFDDAMKVCEEAMKSFAYYDESARVSKLRMLSNEILEGESKFRDGVIPVDLPSNNDRIIAQNGLFVLPANFEGFESNLIKTLGVGKESFGEGMENVDLERVGEILRCKRLASVKFVIEGQLGKDVKKLLKAANITPRTIYPDISGVVPFVRY